jgi:hypothetical protein
MPKITGYYAQWFESVDELDTKHDGTVFDANDGHREYTRQFLVRVVDKRLGPLAVCTAQFLPRPWSSYQSKDGLEWDIRALAQQISAKQDDGDWAQWTVTVKYSTRMPPGGIPQNPGWPAGPDGVGGHQKGAANNPELEPPEERWEMLEVHRAWPVDLDGKAFVNTASVPLNPAPAVEVGMPVYVLTRNELNFNYDTAAKYSFAVNSDTIFGGAKPGMVRLRPPVATKQFKGDYEYWRVTYRFEIFVPFVADFGDGERVIQKDWQPVYLNMGLQELKLLPKQGGGFEYRPNPIYSVGGQTISEPVFLNALGTRKESQTVKDKDGVDQQVILPEFIYRRVYRSLPFKKLIEGGLDQKVP